MTDAGPRSDTVRTERPVPDAAATKGAGTGAAAGERGGGGGADGPARSSRAVRTLGPRRSHTRRAVLQFAATGLGCLLLVGLVGAVVSRQVARAEAIGDAQLVNNVLARSVIQPNLSDRLGAPAAERTAADEADWQRLDRAVRATVRNGAIVRVKLWTSDGRIVYSDESRLEGERFPLGDEEIAALRSGETEAEISDLSRPENRYERGHGELLEVYRPVVTPDGRRLLFETYTTYSTVTERERRIWAEFAPILFAALLLLQLVQIPLARRMARRLDANQAEREALMQQALTASDAARRRIAGDLHDGVVQDLLAVSYGLTGSSARAGAAGRDDEAAELRGAADSVRGGIRSLRSLLVEIYPPSLREAGLPAALADLASTVTDRGVEVDLDVPDRVTASAEAEQLVFRTAQEVLRNVVSHSRATLVRVTLREERGQLVLTVADDGVGFDPDGRATEGERGHFGLRLVRDVAADAGALLEIDSAPGDGTRVRLEVPLA